MRIALLADIHANRQALDACMRHAAARGVTQTVFLGDFVGYGADAVAVVDAIAAAVARGAIAVKGNHDAAIEAPAGYFNDAAHAALAWARATLDRPAADFLAGLPLALAVAPACYAHASAAHPGRWDYLDSARAAARCAEASAARYTFVGHVHDQVLYYEGTRGQMIAFRPVPGTPIPVAAHRRWVAIVGSVGQPRDRNPAAAYAIFDVDARHVVFHRVPYDHHAAALAIRRAGLPESLAYRVEAGI